MSMFCDIGLARAKLGTTSCCAEVVLYMSVVGVGREDNAGAYVGEL